MEKLLNSFIVIGYILTIMLMPIFFGVILFSSFLDFTPTIHPQPGHEDHNTTKIWEGMSKEDYQRIQATEEEKKSNYVDYKDEPTFDPNEPSNFNLYEVENNNDEYEKYLPN
ncbi:hypothetical protein [Peribacillus simplex]|uniref:hypothetical protein n=1 Tax=Peribacillus simplex TaxID=1478 RepID=UPI003D2865A3